MDVKPKRYKSKLGCCVDNLDEMDDYYKGFGKREGFPMKPQTTKKESNGIVRYVTFSCGCSGKPKSQFSNAWRLQPRRRSGCEVNLKDVLMKIENGFFEI